METLVIEAVMPKGVEHFESLSLVRSIAAAVIEAVMPKGVEHIIGRSPRVRWVRRVIEAVMPKGVEHSIRPPYEEEVISDRGRDAERR